MHDQVVVELLRQPTEQDGEPMKWLARVGGGVFPIAGLEVVLDDAGQAQVMLAVPASSVVLGERPEGLVVAPKLRTAAPEKPVGSWGQPGTPDPRESIPGWRESLGAQVAGNAEKTATVDGAAVLDLMQTAIRAQNYVKVRA